MLRTVKSLPAAKPLADESAQLLSRELPRFKKPTPPILGIDQLTLAFKDNYVAVRNMFFIPWMLGMVAVLCLQGEDVYRSWKGAEQRGLWRIDLEIEKHGEDYLTASDSKSLQKFVAVFEGRTLPFMTYMTQMRYSHNFYAYPDRTRQTDILMTSIPITILLFLGAWSVSMRRHAPLFFDRERRIVYTWRSGEVWAQRYEKFSYFSNFQSLYLYLRRLDPKDENARPWLVYYPLQPSGNPLMNARILQDNVLIAIVKFMEQGRDAVWSEDWQGRPPFYFRVDSKPQDFEQQLETLLRKIDLGE
ncbi:MAG: hypothetical protein VYA55_22905 [Pseudomonadota bacterium]|nr:hypothetical protein [Pseudomonadota bacterium]